MKITWIFLFLMGITSQAIAQQLIDEKATAETKNLYANMWRLAKSGVMIGQQDVFASGTNWKDQIGRSDIKDIVGEYPAVLGWDLGKIEVNKLHNFDTVLISRIPDYVKFAYEKGLINTFSWHANNPVKTEEGVRYTTVDSTIKKVLSNPEIKERYARWLDKLATFFLSLKGDNGELIPIIFRPFHEHTGDWFWWGKRHCTPEEYKELWRFTVTYLKNKNVHNLIYSYSTAGFYSKAEYLERYPGDEYVDMVGFDLYDKIENVPQDKFQKNAIKMVNMLKEISTERNKLSAFTEVGLKEVPRSNWWTNTLLPVIEKSGLSYVLIWRNGSATSYWSTYPGQTSAADFKSFYQSPNLIFGKKVSAKKVYHK